MICDRFKHNAFALHAVDAYRKCGVESDDAYVVALIGGWHQIEQVIVYKTCLSACVYCKISYSE